MVSAVISQAKNVLIDKATGLMSDVWVRWFQTVIAAVNASGQQISAPSLTAQSSAITVTAFPIRPVAAGRYRVTLYARITTPASVSSSLDVTIGWTDGGVACSQDFGAITGNTTVTTASETFTFRADQGSQVTYATAYVSSGTPMAYALDLVLEALP